MQAIEWVSSIRRFLVRVIRHLPLISGLPDCRWVDYTESFKEVIVNFLLSTSPLWLGSLITFGVDKNLHKTTQGYLTVLLGSLSDGEMLIYATAAIAPMFYFALTKSEKSRDFPSRLSHIVCGLLIFMICTALFGVQRSGAKMDPNFILPGSLIIYTISIGMIFIATTYRNWRGGADALIQRAEAMPQAQEDDFVRRAREHRNG